MTIETLLRDSDPALGVDVPGPDSAVGGHIRSRVVSSTFGPPDGVAAPAWGHRPLRIPVAAALAVALVGVVLVTVLPATLGRSSSPAAAELSRLASRAAVQPTTLGPGQYLYTETQGQTYVIGAAGPTPGSPTYQEYLSGTTQTWVAADGSGRQVVTTDPTPRFFTAADQAAWVADGEPAAAVPPDELTTVQDYGPGGVGENHATIALYDVSNLPTDPTALSSVLGSSPLPTGISAAGDDSNCTSSACTLFERAVALLQGPDIGDTPALRSALYQVLASVPGVQLLGTTTDRAGQTGTGLQLVDRVPAGTATITCTATSVTKTYDRPATATTYTIVVDPQTTTLLSSEETFTPSVQTNFGSVCWPRPTGSPQTTTVNPTWTIVLDSGVANSDTSPPSADGS